MVLALKSLFMVLNYENVTQLWAQKYCHKVMAKVRA